MRRALGLFVVLLIAVLLWLLVDLFFLNGERFLLVFPSALGLIVVALGSMAVAQARVWRAVRASLPMEPVPVSRRTPAALRWYRWSHDDRTHHVRSDYGLREPKSTVPATWIDVAVASGGPPVDLRAQRRTPWLERLGLEPDDAVTLGDREFDEAVLVLTRDPARARTFLEPRRRAALRALVEVFDRVSVESTLADAHGAVLVRWVVRGWTYGWPPRPQKAIEALPRLAELADALASTRSASPATGKHETPRGA